MVGDDDDHAGEGLGGACIYTRDAASGYIALQRVQVEGVLDTMLVGVGRRSPDLLWSVDAVEGYADGPAWRACGRAHRSSESSSRTRVMMLRASGTLKALSRKGSASSSSISAAARKFASPAGSPRRASSAFVARQGLCATPPSARRTSRTTPSSTSSAAATETRVKA